MEVKEKKREKTRKKREKKMFWTAAGDAGAEGISVCASAGVSSCVGRSAGASGCVREGGGD